jgi:hypothetical protein
MSVQKVEGDIPGLWKQRTLAYPVFGEFASKISSVDARCGEVLQDFPNSVDHGDTYVTFLIECATDFHRAILQRDRVDGMESGRSVAVDLCFKAMICAYPLYVKKDMMATNGDFVKRDAVGPGGSQSASSSQGAGSQNSSGSSSGMEGLLDAAVEESIGRRLLLRSRTRMAVQAAVESRRLDAEVAVTIYIASIYSVDGISG